jgi:Tfp pilus assembly protein PilF
LLNFLGAGYAAQSHWEAATRTFERSLAVDPCFAPAHLNLAECYIRRGDRQGAIARIDLAEAFNVGNVFGITSAITRLRKELQLPPDQSSSAELTLISYETTENITEEDRRVVGVLRALAKYAVQEEERCKILNNIGAHFADCGKPQTALAYFHNALAVARVSGPDRFQLAHQILSHMRNTCRKAGFAEAADYDTMMAIISP